jgi:hypothetical protein
VSDEKAKLARLDAQIAADLTTPPSWGIEDYRAALQDGLGDISGLLELATSDEKNALYQLIGLRLTYTRTGPGKGHLAAVIRPRLEQRGAMLRVGGGTRDKTPPVELIMSDLWLRAA